MRALFATSRPEMISSCEAPLLMSTEGVGTLSGAGGAAILLEACALDARKRPPAPSPLRFRFASASASASALASASASASASALDDLWGVQRLSCSALPLLEARALHERGRRRSRPPAPSPLDSRFASTSSASASASASALDGPRRVQCLSPACASALDDLLRVRCLSRSPAQSLPSCSSALVSRTRVLLALRFRLALPSLRSDSLSSSWSRAWTPGGSKCTPEHGSACSPRRRSVCSATAWILPMIATSNWRLASACARLLSKLWNRAVTEPTKPSLLPGLSPSAVEQRANMAYRGRKLGIAQSQDS